MEELAHHLAALRPTLVRFARRRVRNEAWAEDAVSETLMVALENSASFAQRAQLQTWLIGILKHKLVDQVRRHTREQHLEPEVDSNDDDDGSARHSDRTPLWGVEGSAGWGDPQDRLVRRQFMRELERSLRNLPTRHGRAFVLRECLDVEIDDVCRELGVTANNLSVMLHRARRQLRASLQAQWHPSELRASVPA